VPSLTLSDPLFPFPTGTKTGTKKLPPLRLAGGGFVGVSGAGTTPR
jgi:hypothetical protein